MRAYIPKALIIALIGPQISPKWSPIGSDLGQIWPIRTTQWVRHVGYRRGFGIEEYRWFMPGINPLCVVLLKTPKPHAIKPGFTLGITVLTCVVSYLGNYTDSCDSPSVWEALATNTQRKLISLSHGALSNQAAGDGHGALSHQTARPVVALQLEPSFCSNLQQGCTITIHTLERPQQQSI